MTRFRAIQGLKTMYRMDNRTAILVQEVTKTAGSEVRGRQTARALTLWNRVGGGGRHEASIAGGMPSVHGRFIW